MIGKLWEHDGNLMGIIWENDGKYGNMMVTWDNYGKMMVNIWLTYVW
jgi:hypothetical protein